MSGLNLNNPSKSVNEESLFSFANLYRQYLQCRRRKRGTINALKFELNAEENLFQLSEELRNKTYQARKAVCFIVEKPKLREIIAADFRDRVVHHVLIERLERVFEPIFIHDSYACRKGKGVHAAVNRLHSFIRNQAGNNQPLYYLQLDIKNFFINIDKNILYGLLRHKLRHKDLLWLAREVIFYNPAQDYVIKGNPRLTAKLPAHKSLLHSDGKSGLPIGNLSSQFFANLYLNELDQYVKHTLKCKHYLRYCDDFILLDTNPQRLAEFKSSIERFLEEKLHLTLNEKYGAILPVSNGINFLGYIIRRDYLLVRKRVIVNLKAKLGQFYVQLVTLNSATQICYRYDYSLLNQLRAVIASYLGHMNHADSFHLKQSIFEQQQWLAHYFRIDEVCLTGVSAKLEPNYQHPQLWRRISDQYGYYRHIYPSLVGLFQVGSYVEFYHHLSAELLSLLQLKPLADNSRGALYGFPLKLASVYIARLLANNYSLVVIKETGIQFNRIKQRLPEYTIICSQGVNHEQALN